MNILKKYLPLAASIIALVALTTVAMQFCVHPNKNVYPIQAFKAIFGIGCNFSFFNFLTYLLVAAGAVFCFTAYQEARSIVFNIVAAVLLITAGILFLNVTDFTTVTLSSKVVVSASDVGYKLGAGAIIGSICSFISAICVLISLIARKIPKKNC